MMIFIIIICYYFLTDLYLFEQECMQIHFRHRNQGNQKYTNIYARKILGCFQSLRMTRIDDLPAFEGDKLRLSDARKDQHLDQTERLMSHSSVNCSCSWNKNYIEIINKNLPIKITSLFRLPRIIRSIRRFYPRKRETLIITIFVLHTSTL